mgnify:CR=1 FL=1
MRKPLIHKEIKRPIRHRWLLPEAPLGKFFQDLVGAERAVRFKQYLQRPPSDRCQPRTGPRAHLFGTRHHLARAMGVVMRFEGTSGFAGIFR